MVSWRRRLGVVLVVSSAAGLSLWACGDDDHPTAPGTNDGSVPSEGGQVDGSVDSGPSPDDAGLPDGSDTDAEPDAGPLRLPLLLKDTNIAPIATGRYVGANGKVFFAGGDDINGLELWTLDAVSHQAALVKDIAAGVRDSEPDELVAMNGTLYFVATDPGSGRELWRSDGTAAGTSRVKDIRVGSASSEPSSLVVSGGLLFFIADDGAAGRELWKSDGTEAGTVLVKDIAAGAGSSTFGQLVDSSGILYFTVTNSGSVLWRSDGTNAGTISLGAAAMTMAPSGTDLVFASESTITQLSPDGGQVALYATPGANYHIQKPLYPVGNSVYFWQLTSFPAVTGCNGYALLNTASNPGSCPSPLNGSPSGAGTVLGTHPILPFVCNCIYGPALFAENGSLAIALEATGPFATTGGYAYFSGKNADAGAEVWRTGGTSQTTALVKDMIPGPESAAPTMFSEASGSIYFSAIRPSASSPGPWVSDGTAIGTLPLAPEVAVPSQNMAGSCEKPGTLPGKIVFGGAEPWVTDGTPAGTMTLAKAGTSCEFTPSPAGGLVFAGESDLWQTDGTPGGTKSLGVGSRPRSLVTMGGVVYFIAGGFGSADLWTTDGTQGGTVLVKAGIVSSSWLLAAQSQIFFTSSAQLWRSDGTTVGTIRAAYAPNTDIDALGAIGNVGYFTFHDPGNPDRFTRSDGTEVGTQLISKTRGLLEPSIVFGGALYFVAREYPSPDYYLFRLTEDATDAGADSGADAGAPVTVTSLAMVTPESFIATPSALLFAADDGVHGLELWKTDGTSIGTVLVSDIKGGAESSSPAAFVTSGSNVYFSADNGSLGRELWITDGTQAGTKLLFDAYPGARSSDPHVIAPLGSNIFAIAADTRFGAEPRLISP
jgi:ELWxxDGT repeat protein